MIQDKRTEEIIGAAMAVHSELGAGFLESVYRNSLMIELEERGIMAEAEKPIPVFYKGRMVGDFIADIIVDGNLILELKATRDHHEAHEAQLVNYLKATNTPLGLLFNFGIPSLLYKRKHQNYLPSNNPVHPANPANPVKKSAFSLIELLVAMAVLSLLVVMMLGLVDSATKLWRDSENRVDAYREARAALGIMSRDLRNVLASTNTNFLLLNNDGAFAKVPAGAETNTSRAGAAFFLTALPANAQESGKNKSDICEVGYFLAFERARGATNSAMTLNLYRHFRSSDSSFSNLTSGNLFSDSAVGVAGEELLARNIREFKITPYAFSNNAYVPFIPSTNKAMPDVLELTITAVNQDAAKRFTERTDWTSANPPESLTNAQQTFTTRIRLNQP
ncbi:MAG: GxxExxY protein [Terrimicrobiaceae bacterium]